MNTPSENIVSLNINFFLILSRIKIIKFVLVHSLLSYQTINHWRCHPKSVAGQNCVFQMVKNFYLIKRKNKYLDGT